MSDHEQLARLRQRISQLFSEGELRQLCFDLGLGYDDLDGRGKSENVMELVARMDREGRLPDLIGRLRKLRPKEDWSFLGLQAPAGRAGGSLYNLPFGRNPNFTGREDFLDALQSS